jgi:hypothetical protein
MAGPRQVVASVRAVVAACGSVTLGLLLAMAPAGWAACDPTTTTTTLAPVCGNGIREVGEECDGGAYCSATCTLLGLAPGCCVGGSTGGCADASGWSLNYYMYSYCLSLGGATNIVGGVCSAGTCSVLPLASPVPLCCASNTDGTCSHDGTAAGTADLWHFFNYCEGITMRTYHTVPAAVCGPAGVCVPQ